MTTTATISPTAAHLAGALAEIQQALADTTPTAALRLQRLADMIEREIAVAGGDPKSFSPRPAPAPIRTAAPIAPAPAARPAASAPPPAPLPSPPLAKTIRPISTSMAGHDGRKWPQRKICINGGDLSAAGIDARFVTVEIRQGEITIRPS